MKIICNKIKEIQDIKLILLFYNDLLHNYLIPQLEV